ncbi:glutathione synthetase ATP-binding domain-like protein [Penicillium cf. griseofulvum]|nr:glutathione synthetase ATP-binding domain-like protein [Penicillium cf. griseofulvum]
MDSSSIGEKAFAFETFLVAIDGKMETQRFFHSLDLFLTIASTYSSDDSQIPSTAGTALEQLVRTIRASRDEVEVATKLILVPQGGYPCRSDILDLRLRDSDYVDSVVRFSSPDGGFSPIPVQGDNSLLTLLPSSPGAFLLNRFPTKTPNLLEEDLKLRLSFNWILPTKPARRKIAMVGGRPAFDIAKRSFGHQGAYEATKALDISMVIVDHPGHWLQDETYSYIRDDFIAIDVTDDAGLPRRIAEALEGKGFDGLLTLSDEFVLPTVKAAEILGLSTEPTASYLQAHNKYEARQLLSSNIQSLLLNSAAQLDDSSTAEQLRTFKYPLIVKPCRGGGSRGVKKAKDPLEPPSGCANTGRDWAFETWGFDRTLCRRSRDATDASVADNFVETVMILPSRLDPEELQAIETSLYQGLLNLGFRSGVFHLEARVKNSPMRYQEIDGFIELTHTGSTEGLQPEVVLIEVNARPPGLQAIFAVAYNVRGGLQRPPDPSGPRRSRALRRSSSTFHFSQPVPLWDLFYSCASYIYPGPRRLLRAGASATARNRPTRD